MDQRALQYYHYLISKGESPQVAAAIMGNIGQESGFDVSRVGDNGNSIGLFQFNKNGEQPALRSWAEQNKRDVNDPYAQLDFVRSQLQSPAYSKVYGQMQSAPSVAEATGAFMSGYERPNPRYANPEARVGFANQFGESPTPPAAMAPAAMALAPTQQPSARPSVAGLLQDPKFQKGFSGLASLLSPQPEQPPPALPTPYLHRPQMYGGQMFRGIFG
jgi:hypothetical protein